VTLKDVNRMEWILCFLLWGAACGRQETVEVQLVDSRHRPIILTERRVLALPNAPPGTRFVHGWRFAKSRTGLSIRPEGPTAWLEIAQLAPRERDLVLELVRDPGGAEAFVRARSSDRDLGSFTLNGDIVIPLPADLGPGRVPIGLEFSESAEVASIYLSRAAPRGRVGFEDEEVNQSGWSMIDFVRWVEGGTRLVGEFVPPSDGRPNQRFSAGVGRGVRDVKTVFEAAALKNGRAAGVQSFDVPLLDSSGLVRIRLTAEGRGPAGRWRDLRLVTRRRQPAPEIESIPDPSKLVVLYVFDALRADHVGHLGSELGASPCLDRLASEGVAFDNYFSVAPNTGPATRSLFTGYGFFEGRELSAAGIETIADIYEKAGFVAASFSSNPHLSPSFGLTKGFEHVDFLPLEQDHRVNGEVTVNDSAEQIHAAVLRWLDRRNSDEHLFLYLHTLHPHNPYTPPEPYPSRFVGGEASQVDGRTRTLVSIRELEREVTIEDMGVVRQRYAANLAYNDAKLCRFVDELERRFPGELMLVVTSDHGEELFDHGGVLHGHTLYDEMLHVPLVVRWPGQVPHGVIDEPADTLDLHATLRSLVAPPLQGPENGEDLWGAISGSAFNGGEPRLHFATAPGLRSAAMARSNSWKLIQVPRPRLRWGMGRGRGRTHDAEYLFDLETDPGEYTNLAGLSSLEADWLWSRLQAWRVTWRARQPRETDDPELDEATKRQLEALGYVE
jgi:arylsulfatase A-like enzyme